MLSRGARRVSLESLVATAAVFGLWAFVFSSVAAAACETGAVTFTFLGGPSLGDEQCYTVPAGVSELSITAVGAEGGTGFGVAGFGAVVGGQVAVTPGETLYVEVGSNGSTNGGADFGGGGAGGSDGAGRAARWRRGSSWRAAAVAAARRRPATRWAESAVQQAPMRAVTGQPGALAARSSLPTGAAAAVAVAP